MHQKIFVQYKCAILGSKMAHSHNSGSALRIFLKFYRMKGANRYIKILLVVFRENSFGAIWSGCWCLLSRKWRETWKFLFFEGHWVKKTIKEKEDIVKIQDNAISNLGKEKKEVEWFFKLYLNSFFLLFLSRVGVVL